MCLCQTVVLLSFSLPTRTVTANLVRCHSQWPIACCSSWHVKPYASCFCSCCKHSGTSQAMTEVNTEAALPTATALIPFSTVHPTHTHTHSVSLLRSCHHVVQQNASSNTDVQGVDKLKPLPPVCSTFGACCCHTPGGHLNLHKLRAKALDEGAHTIALVACAGAGCVQQQVWRAAAGACEHCCGSDCNAWRAQLWGGSICTAAAKHGAAQHATSRNTPCHQGQHTARPLPPAPSLTHHKHSRPADLQL